MITNISDEELIKMHEDGMLHREIAALVGCGVSTVTHRLLKLGVRSRIPIDKSEVERMHNSGMSDREIADVMHCTRSNITVCLNKLGYTSRKSKVDNIELRNRISASLIGRYTGSNNPNYKGYAGLMSVARGIAKTISKRIIRNGDHRCEACGRETDRLESHHIKPFNIIMSEFFNNVYDGDAATLYEQLTSYDDFTNEQNMAVLCEKCHHDVHYSDNHELSPYRWESATTIETGA